MSDAQMRPESPVNPIPRVVLALFGCIVVVEMVLTMANQGLVGGAQGVGWRIYATQEFAISPALVDRMFEHGDYSWGTLRRFVGYTFVHINFTHALFAGALLLALGKFISDFLHPASVFAIYVASAVAGALAFAFALDGRMPLVGAYPPVYGFIGAYTYLTWLNLKFMGANQLNAFRLIAVLLALQLVFALLFGGNKDWIADVAGFVVGFGMTTLLVPGGWAAFLARLRNR